MFQYPVIRYSVLCAIIINIIKSTTFTTITTITIKLINENPWILGIQFVLYYISIKKASHKLHTNCCLT